MRNCLRPTSAEFQPMPAFCVMPNRSPLGLCSNMSSVMGKLPAGPVARVLIWYVSGAPESNMSLVEFMGSMQQSLENRNSVNVPAGSGGPVLQRRDRIDEQP